jgi:small subunit ribosomal protein S20
VCLRVVHLDSGGLGVYNLRVPPEPPAADAASAKEEEDVPNIKSRIRDIKKNRANRLRNMSAKSAIKTATKKLVGRLEEKDPDKAREALRTTQKAIDTTWSRGIIHKNQAARRKSRLAKRVNRAQSESTKG